MTPASHPRIGFRTALVVVALGLVELVSYSLFVTLLSDRLIFRVDFEAIRGSVTQDMLTDFVERNWDSRLGWRLSRGVSETTTRSDGSAFSTSIDDKGARLNPHPATRSEISLYGDSYTFCEDVDDRETWAFYLSELTGTRVENWGVGGYGTDQALLRLEGNLPEHHTRIVVLAVFSENINRLMNSYRPFYFPRTGIKLGFKPMLAVVEGKLAWQPNPLQRAATLADYHRAYDRAKALDYWYRENQSRPRARFPFSLAIARAARYVLFDRNSNLFELPEATRRMDRIVEDFVRLSEEYDFAPLLLFLPSENDLRAFTRNRATSYRPYLQRLRERPDLDGLELIDLLEQPIEPEKFNLSPFRGHASPYGNRAIASAVHETLRRQLP